MAPMHVMPSSREIQTAPIRAFTSLTRRDADAVRATVRAAGGIYTVDEHDDYEGYLSMVLTAPEGGPAYLVWGRTKSVELAEVGDDDLLPIGQYASIGAAMIVLRSRLEQALWRP